MNAQLGTDLAEAPAFAVQVGCTVNGLFGFLGGDVDPLVSVQVR
jgi:hypothetical protein